MTRVEQLVYTTGHFDGSPGYHVKAKSPGISGKTISDLDPYMLPAGIDPKNFKCSRSMVLVRDGAQVAYSLTRNIGCGPDGRPDALSSHTLILDVKNFGDLSYDTRRLDALFTNSLPSTPLLPSLEVAPDADIQPDGGFVRSEAPLLTRILYAIVREKGVGVRGVSDVRLIQAALGLLPPSLRLVPFSTCAVDTKLQSAYRLVLLGDLPVVSLPKNFAAVDAKSRLPHSDADLERTVRYIVAMASIEDPHLEALHVDFETVAVLPPRERLKVLTAVLRMAQSDVPPDEDPNAQMLANSLAKLDSAACGDILSGPGMRMKWRRRSLLEELITTRRAHHHISDYAPTRASVERLMCQAKSPGRRDLLQALYQSKKPEMDGNIEQLLGDFAYSYYREDFFQFIASVPDLSRHVKKFVGTNDKNPMRRQTVARLFVLASAGSGSAASIEPAIFKPYDLGRGVDLDSFESLLLDALSHSAVANDPDVCDAVAIAGLTYMAGFGRSYAPTTVCTLQRRAVRFSALADRLGQMVLSRDGLRRGERSGPKAGGDIAQLLRECGIVVSGAGV